MATVLAFSISSSEKLSSETKIIDLVVLYATLCYEFTALISAI